MAYAAAASHHRPLTDTEQALQIQQQAIDPTCHVWVSASAGTGKTKVLTDRLLSLLLQGINARKILCLTFTNAAAAEMMQRLLERLGHWASCEEEILRTELRTLIAKEPSSEVLQRARILFVDILETPGGFRIQTIHGFCQSLLAAFPLEAGLALETTVATDRERQELLKQAQEIVLNDTPQDTALADSITLLAEHFHSETFKQLCDTLLQQKLKMTLVLAQGFEVACQNTLRALGLESAETSQDILQHHWGREAVVLREELKQASFLLREGKSTDQRRGEAIQHWLESAQTIEDFYTYATTYLTTTGEKRQKLVTRELALGNPSLETLLDREATHVQEMVEYFKKQKIAQVSLALLRLSDTLLNRYEELKAQKQVLDYDDLILKSSLLLHHAELAPWILYKLEGGIDHLLVDEAQDTNTLQWSIIKALTEEFFSGITDKSRTLFAVGDAKQSIYSFQGTDPEIFAAMRRYFAGQAVEAQRPWRTLEMSLSFRSTAPILEFIDRLFSQETVRIGVYEEAELHHLCFRSGQAGHLELWPVVGPPEEDSKALSPRFMLAQHVAQQIEDWFNQGEILASKGRLLKPSDIMILVRNRTEFVPALIQALKTKGIPVGGLDRLILLDQLAIQDLLALADFLLLPEDNFSLACVLKSPLGGLSEDDLFHLATTRGERTLWENLKDQKDRFKGVHDRLATWLGKVDFLPPFSLFSEILFRYQGWSQILERFGRDAVDSLEEFLALAYEYQTSSTPSLQGFLHWLKQGRLEIKRDFSQTSLEEIRIMTVHGAKGLQAPVVILADTATKPLYRENFIWPSAQNTSFLWSPSQAYDTSYTHHLKSHFKTLQDQEYRRLLYVALTRGEERLYVCGSHDQEQVPEGCWYHLIREIFPKNAEKISFAWGEGLRHCTRQSSEISFLSKIQRENSINSAPPAWVFNPAIFEKESFVPKRVNRSEITLNTFSSQTEIEHYGLKKLTALPEKERLKWLEDFNPSIFENVIDLQKAKKTLKSLLQNPQLAFLFSSHGRTDVASILNSTETEKIFWLDHLVVLTHDVWGVIYDRKKTSKVYYKNLKKIPLFNSLQQLYPHHQIKIALLQLDTQTLIDITSL